ncbi:hypothetical protein D6764_05195 [Candidatus Woesearchaeota archaeon]|nr:MAG: hypothetical protein D6764_05195 [Candidatus Woesearchaeota archaeon]
MAKKVKKITKLEHFVSSAHFFSDSRLWKSFLADIGEFSFIAVLAIVYDSLMGMYLKSKVPFFNNDVASLLSGQITAGEVQKVLGLIMFLTVAFFVLLFFIASTARFYIWCLTTARKFSRKLLWKFYGFKAVLYTASFLAFVLLVQWLQPGMKAYNLWSSLFAQIILLLFFITTAYLNMRGSLEVLKSGKPLSSLSKSLKSIFTPDFITTSVFIVVGFALFSLASLLLRVFPELLTLMLSILLLLLFISWARMYFFDYFKKFERG